MCKYKKRVKNLQMAQNWWDKQSPTYQKANTRPKGINQRTVTDAK